MTSQFTKGVFLLKPKGKTGKIRCVLFPIIIAVLITALVSLLFGYLVQCGFAPEVFLRAFGMISISAGACAAGAISGGGGKRGVLVGALIAVIWSVWRMTTNPSSFMMVYTWIEIALCILFSCAGSCIFHKKRKGNTKRNRRAAPAR